MDRNVTDMIARIEKALDTLTHEERRGLSTSYLAAKIAPIVSAEIDRAMEEESERLERDRCWSSAGGRHAEAQAAEGLMLARAGELFAAGKDELATEVRSLARKLQERTKAASDHLQGFIAEARRKDR